MRTEIGSPDGSLVTSSKHLGQVGGGLLWRPAIVRVL